ncbi:MAG: chromosome segregation protein SMC [Halolamina sp.]
MGNRVEELESRVAALQATVDGLTEELVETKERLRQLEAGTDVAPDDTDGVATDGNAHVEFVPNADRAVEASEAATSSATGDGGSEIVDADARDGATAGAAAGESDDDEVNGREHESGDDSDGDDIIVA